MAMSYCKNNNNRVSSLLPPGSCSCLNPLGTTEGQIPPGSVGGGVRVLRRWSALLLESETKSRCQRAKHPKMKEIEMSQTIHLPLNSILREKRERTCLVCAARLKKKLQTLRGQHLYPKVLSNIILPAPVLLYHGVTYTSTHVT